jgi:hypothetical protein
MKQTLATRYSRMTRLRLRLIGQPLCAVIPAQAGIQ